MKLKDLITNYYIKLLVYLVGLGISFDHIGTFYQFNSTLETTDLWDTGKGAFGVVGSSFFGFNGINGFALAGAILFSVLLVKTLWEGKE